MALSLEVTGVDEALSNISAIRDGVTDEKAQAAAVKALEPIAQRARELAPVDSGELRDSIVVSTLAPRGGHQSRDGGRNSVFDGRSVWVGPIGSVQIAYYAGFIEFGTVRMRAQPFLGPAVIENEDLVFEIFGAQMGKEILGAV